MSALPLTRITPQEYLDIERAAEIKSEYYDGEMFAMSGGSLAHSQIPLDLYVVLKRQLDGKGCRVSNSDLKVRISPRGPFVYPDLTIYSGKAELADDQKDILLNPIVVFEVLSKSSEAYDRGQKFSQYRRVESLRDYVLVSQHEPKVEVFSRDQDGRWSVSETCGMESVCPIPSVGCLIPLGEIYSGISFEQA